MALLLTPVDASEDVSIILFKCFFFLLWVWQGVSGVNPTPSITVTFLISFKFLFHSSSFHCLPPRRSYFIAAAPILLPVPYVLFMTIFFFFCPLLKTHQGVVWSGGSAPFEHSCLLRGWHGMPCPCCREVCAWLLPTPKLFTPSNVHYFAAQHCSYNHRITMVGDEL